MVVPEHPRHGALERHRHEALSGSSNVVLEKLRCFGCCVGFSLKSQSREGSPVLSGSVAGSNSDSAVRPTLPWASDQGEMANFHGVIFFFPFFCFP